MFFLCRLMGRKRFFYANSFNWSLTSPVILDTHAAVEPSWSRNLTEIVVYKYSTHCFSLDFGSECLQRRKKSLSVFVLDSKRKTEQSLWNTLFIYSRVLFVTFSCCVNIVVPFLVCINIDSFGVIISSRVIRRKKSFSPFFSKWKSGQVEGTFWTPSRQPVNQFGWNLANLLSDSFLKKPYLPILISFSSKSIFSQVVLMICYPRLQLLITKEQTQLTKI